MENKESRDVFEMETLYNLVLSGMKYEMSNELVFKRSIRARRSVFHVRGFSLLPFSLSFEVQYSTGMDLR